MKSLAYHPNPRRQAGAALMIFLAVFVLGIAALLLSELNRADLMLEQQAETTRALAQAKEALIGYAVTSYDDHPGWYGLLPNPNRKRTVKNMITEGVETDSVDQGEKVGKQNQSLLYKLPWRSLGLEPLRDGTGECLWYAVSGPHKNSPSSDMLNEDTRGRFEVWVDNSEKLLNEDDDSYCESNDEKTLLAEDVVAVIIAPGEILNDQQRKPDDIEAETMCGDKYDSYDEDKVVYNYLDGKTSISNFLIQTEMKNEDTVKTYRFITAQDHLNCVNDRIVYITREELFESVRQRTDFYDKMQCLTLIAAHCLADYATQGKTEITDRRLPLPWAAPVDLAGKKYSKDSSYVDKEGLLKGRLPKIVTDSNELIGKSAELITAECVSGLTLEESQLCDFDGEVFMELWRNWKDHLFYVVAEAHKPSALTTTPACASNNCLQMEGQVNQYYAGIVIFADKALDGKALDGEDQSRQTEDEQGKIDNYLEGINATSPGGNGTYKQRLIEEFVDTDDKTQINIEINDILYCIKNEEVDGETALQVDLCP